MRSWSRKVKAQESDSEVGVSSGKRNSISEPAVPVWVNHSPTPSNITDEDEDDENSTGCTSSSLPNAPKEKNKMGSMKDRLMSIIPPSWRGVNDKSTREYEYEPAIRRINILPNGTRVSPPVSPLLGRRKCPSSLGTTSQNSRKHLLVDEDGREESFISSIHPAEYYAEKLEVYNQKYSYLKSWPGLLRLLAGVELLFGAMVLACVIAYVQKDSEWSNTYGQYNGIYNNGLGVSGYSYNGPMTAFVLVVAGFSWILTFCLLVIGMSMYYRTILLDASWWPPTEAFINVALFLLYMAAAITYVNDLNRGGLCYMTIGVHPIMAHLCRVEGGQMAGTAFMFINLVLYLGSFLISLRMWRHEAARRERKHFENKHQGESIPLGCPKTKPMSFEDEMDKTVRKNDIGPQATVPDAHKNPVRMMGDTVKKHTSSSPVVADYIVKYPEISSLQQREMYKAVFNDQYQEYKDLYRDISTSLDKFRELDALMARLLRDGKSQEDHQRIQIILKNYQQKKNDPAFLDKKERCDYLKAKLRHIKSQISMFDQGILTNETAGNKRVLS